MARESGKSQGGSSRQQNRGGSQRGQKGGRAQQRGGQRQQQNDTGTSREQGQWDDDSGMGGTQQGF